MTNQRHPHADLIIAWANGAEIEYFHECDNRWYLTTKPEWNPNKEYRLKPKTVTKTVRVKLYKYSTDIVYAATESNWKTLDDFYGKGCWLTEPIEISYQEPLSE